MHGKIAGLIAGALLLTATVPALAQDENSEIIVSAMRKLGPDGDEGRPIDIIVSTPAAVQMLRRTADFAVQQVIIISDTDEEEPRREEIRAMIRNAIGLAGKSGVELATGELVVEPLTTANARELAIVEDDESNGELVRFLVKTPLAPGIDARTALDRIAKFVKAVPAVGRAEMKPYSELTLSVVNPEQYRGAIIDLVARDTQATSGRFGAGYGVEVTGLDRPVQWKRASLTEVQLFLPSASTVRPRN